jgi:hypothetical protein
MTQKLFVQLTNERGIENLFKIDISACILRYIYFVTAKRELEIVKIFQAMHVLRH